MYSLLQGLAFQGLVQVSSLVLLVVLQVWQPGFGLELVADLLLVLRESLLPGLAFQGFVQASSQLLHWSVQTAMLWLSGSPTRPKWDEFPIVAGAGTYLHFSNRSSGRKSGMCMISPKQRPENDTLLVSSCRVSAGRNLLALAFQHIVVEAFRGPWAG